MRTLLQISVVTALLWATHAHPRAAASARQQRQKNKEGEAPEHESMHDPACPNARVNVTQAIEVLKNNTCRHMGVGGMWPKDAVELAKALKTNTALEILDLNQYNEIGDQGATAIGEALAEKTSGLQTLFLANNAITEEGFAAIVAAVDPFDGNNTRLQSIDLAANEIGPGGAKALSKALKYNEALQALYLGQNSIGDKGCKALMSSLKTNRHLKTIFLRRNGISNTCMKTAVKALQDNHVITRLDVDPHRLSITNEGGELGREVTPDDNVIDEPMLRKVQEIIKRNREQEIEDRRQLAIAEKEKEEAAKAIEEAKKADADAEEDESLSTAEL